MADSSKYTNYKRDFNAANYDRIEITVKKGAKSTLQQAAKEKGESINGYIKTALKTQYKSDTGEDIEL